MKEIISLNKASILWDSWLKQLNFLNRLHDQELRLHVGFGYYLGAPIEADLWRRNRWNHDDYSQGLKLIDDYRRETHGIDRKYFLSELDPSKSQISIPLVCDGRELDLTTDVVRMQVEVSNMARLQLLDGLRSVVEIGAGYGALSANLFKLGIVKRCVIIDLPEVLEISRRWISFVLKSEGLGHIEFTSYSDQELSEHGLKDIDGFHFVSQINFNKLSKPISTDLVININSFCEMSETQVDNYINGKKISYKYLYSSNRDRQFMNLEIGSLLEIFKKNGLVWPNYSELSRNELSALKKYVYVLTRENHRPYEGLDFKTLSGIFGREMMAITA